MTLSPDNPGPVVRRRARAKQACTSCHSRRIRCNVTETHPCFNCLSTGNTCKVVPSKRGRHKRVPKPGKRPATPGDPELSEGARQTRQSERSVFAAQDLLDHPPASIVEGPQTLQHDSSPTSGGASFRREGVPEVPTPSYDNATASPSLNEGGMFFGESNALTCVASDEQSHDIANGTATNRALRQKPKYYSIPDNLGPGNAGHFSTEEDWTFKRRLLQQQGALDVPDREQYTPVLQEYFRWFHPCYPILDKTDFSNMYSEDRISPLLLNAILFVGVTYSALPTIHALGYSDLGSAKSQLFRRTKVLFEADWETNSLTVLQALFLLTFVRAPMTTIKGHRYWLSAAINLAQLHGLHRASPQSSGSSPQVKLRRRIWWSLYVRDIHSSVSLGLPARVRDEDCDVAMLCPSDLLDDVTPAVDWLASPPTTEQITYATSMPRLMILLSRIARNFFAPTISSNEPQSSPSELMELIEKWKSELPPPMQVIDTASKSPNMWTCLLHLAYNHLIILLYRHEFMNQRTEGQNAIQAARRVSLLAEEMLAQGMVKRSQLYLITSVFAALCIHTIHLKQSQGLDRRLGENRAKICLLCLKEAQTSWNINNDILDLFFQHVETRVAEEFQKEVADYTLQSRDAATDARSDNEDINKKNSNSGDSTSYTNNNENAHFQAPLGSEDPLGALEHSAAYAILGISGSGREPATPSQEGMSGYTNHFNVLGGYSDELMPFFSPDLNFFVGDDMGL